MLIWNEARGLFEAKDHRKGTDIEWPNPHIAELFINEVKACRDKYQLGEQDIAKMFEVSVLTLRLMKSTAYRTIRDWRRGKALKMHEEGISVPEIACRLGVSESTARMLLDEEPQAKLEEA